jgi:hypothetical protein
MTLVAEQILYSKIGGANDAILPDASSFLAD